MKKSILALVLIVLASTVQAQEGDTTQPIPYTGVQVQFRAGPGLMAFNDQLDIVLNLNASATWRRFYVGFYAGGMFYYYAPNYSNGWYQAIDGEGHDAYFIHTFSVDVGYQLPIFREYITLTPFVGLGEVHHHNEMMAEVESAGIEQSFLAHPPMKSGVSLTAGVLVDIFPKHIVGMTAFIKGGLSENPWLTVGFIFRVGFNNR